MLSITHDRVDQQTVELCTLNKWSAKLHSETLSMVLSLLLFWLRIFCLKGYNAASLYPLFYVFKDANKVSMYPCILKQHKASKQSSVSLWRCSSQMHSMPAPNIFTFCFYVLMSWGPTGGQQTEYNTKKAVNDVSGGYNRFSTFSNINDSSMSNWGPSAGLYLKVRNCSLQLGGPIDQVIPSIYQALVMQTHKGLQHCICIPGSRDYELTAAGYHRPTHWCCQVLTDHCNECSFLMQRGIATQHGDTCSAYACMHLSCPPCRSWQGYHKRQFWHHR